MKIINQKERNALAHYNRNVSYYDEEKYINASMAPEGLISIFDKLNIYFEDIPVNILDFGCGIGGTIAFLARNYTSAKFTGIDYSEERLKHAHQLTSKWGDRVKLIRGDVNIFVDECVEKFDYILAFEIIEHLENPEMIVAKLKTLLSHKGVLICTIPYQDAPNDVHLSAFKDQQDVENKLNLEFLSGEFKMRFPYQHVFYYKK